MEILLWDGTDLTVPEDGRFPRRSFHRVAAPGCTGWLHGPHPNVGEGEVTRTVCFTGFKFTCYWRQEISVKNCSGYFVYRLWPTSWSNYVVYCTVTDSALGDPCVTHTILDQPWRSMDCSNTDCTGGELMGDGNLEEGWYRFHSPGGWKIPETVIPQGRCSGLYSGWLNGPHPNVGEGEVTRTVCFTGIKYNCYWRRKIRVKNCSGYFVYWLWSTPRSNAVYCTDSQLDTTQEPQGTTTGGPGLGLSTTPAGSASSGSSTGKQTDGSVSGEHTQKSSSVPAGDTSPDAGTSTGKQSEGSSTGDFSQDTSSIPAGGATSGPGTSTGKQSGRSSTGDFPQETSSVPARDTASDPLNSKGTSRKPSSGPEKETCSVKGLPSKDECEEMINSVKVFIIGKNKLGNPEEREAYIRQVRKMLMEQLPCKHVLSKSEHDSGGGK